MNIQCFESMSDIEAVNKNNARDFLVWAFLTSQKDKLISFVKKYYDMIDWTPFIVYFNHLMPEFWKHFAIFTIVEGKNLDILDLCLEHNTVCLLDLIYTLTKQNYHHETFKRLIQRYDKTLSAASYHDIIAAIMSERNALSNNNQLRKLRTILAETSFRNMI